MKLDESKLQEIVEKIAYQQFADEQIEDLYAKMGILNQYVQEQLMLSCRIGLLRLRSDKIELLDRYTKFLQKRGYIDMDATYEEPFAIDEFMRDEHT